MKYLGYGLIGLGLLVLWIERNLPTLSKDI